MRPTYFLTCLTPDNFTRKWGTGEAPQLNGLIREVDRMSNKAKEV